MMMMMMMMYIESFPLPTNNNDQRMQDGNVLSRRPRNAHRLFDCVSRLVFISKTESKVGDGGEENTTGGRFVSCSLRANSEISFFFLFLNISRGITESGSALIVPAEESGRPISITLRPQPLLLVFSSAATHGGDSAPRCTRPCSGTPAGSPESRRMCRRSCSSCRRSCVRRRAPRNRPGSGRWVYLGGGRKQKKTRSLAIDVKVKKVFP